ncbi:MAG: hypothetical protein JWN65_1824 [Solirubrobacterales bacterium]|nr:hypothetical protein [Solirubrobacterales bacterium]
MTPTTEPAATGARAPDTDQAVTEQAQEKLREGAQTAREQAQNATQQARDRAREQVDQRTTEAGQRLKGTAGDARSMAEHLRSEGKDGPARMVEQAADRAESLGGYLHDADADRLLRDVEDYARRNPWAVIAGGLLAGFAASRVVSASSASRQAVSRGSGPARELPVPSSGQRHLDERGSGERGTGDAPDGEHTLGGEPYASRPADRDVPRGPA